MKSYFLKYKLYISRLLRVICLLCVLLSLYYILDYAIVDDTSAQARISFHDYYSMEHVDNLFVGTSHTANGINSVRLSELTGKECFNIGSSAQPLLCSYYIIREAVERGNVDRIFFEISIDSLFWDKEKESFTCMVSDYMDSLQRYKLITDSLDYSMYMNAFSKVRRNADTIRNVDEIKKIIKSKNEEQYKSFNGNKVNMGRGQWKSKRDYPLYAYGDGVTINLASDDLKFRSLEKIKEYNLTTYSDILNSCKNSNTQLIVYIMPVEKCYLNYFENSEDGYGKIIEQLRSEAAEENVTFVDFNTVKEEYLKFEVADFKDMEHLTSKGSKRLADFLAEYITNPSGDYFYNDWHERYSSEDEVLAVGFNTHFITENGEYDTEDAVKGDISSVRIELSALTYKDIPVDARVSKVVLADGKERDADAKWEEKEDIEVRKIDDYVSEINITYDGMESFYKVSLHSPEGVLIYEAITKFDMK